MLHQRRDSQGRGKDRAEVSQKEDAENVITLKSKPPHFSQTSPDICVILKAGLLIIVQRKIPAKALGFLMYLYTSNSAISILSGLTHLLHVAFQLFTY